MECCSITSFFGEDAQVSIPLLCCFTSSVVRRRKVGQSGWYDIRLCTGRLPPRAPSAAGMNSGKGLVYGLFCLVP